MHHLVLTPIHGHNRHGTPAFTDPYILAQHSKLAVINHLHTGITIRHMQVHKCLDTENEYGDRAFSVAGPTVWNGLPESVRLTKTFPSFKHNL